MGTYGLAHARQSSGPDRETGAAETVWEVGE